MAPVVAVTVLKERLPEPSLIARREAVAVDTALSSLVLSDALIKPATLWLLQHE